MNSLKYVKHYNLLIDSRLKLNRDKSSDYFEIHHIIPKCLGGTNDQTNLVLLTPEEHFIAHLLLTKIYPDNHSIVFAAWMMTASSDKNPRNNKAYGWLKRRFSKAMSESKKQLPPEKNPMFGKFGKDNPNFGKKRTSEQCKRISDSLLGDKHPMFGKFGKDNPNFGKKRTEEQKQKLKKPKSEEHKRKLKKPKSEEHKHKLREAFSKIDRTGENNSCFGKKWINKNGVRKKVTENELPELLSSGWILGRGF